MFETVAPELTSRRSRKVFYETLPLSLGVHGIVIAAIMASMLWKIEFPSQSPKLFQTYNLVAAPTPPPPPPPPARRAVPVNVVIPPEMRNLAPTIIPDTVPDLSAPPPTEVYEGPFEGVEGGVEGGVAGGVVGGTVASVAPPEPPPPPPPPQREVVEVERDAPLPMRAISQDYPTYPEFARTRGYEDSLVVRYIIDKHGRVREIITLTPPSMKIFEEEAHKTIRQWRFQPFSEQGETKEVIHELTVQFRIAKPSSGRR